VCYGKCRDTGRTFTPKADMMDPAHYCCRIRNLCCGKANCARQHCITCSRQLPLSKIRSGSRRCAVCVKARPGRLYNTGWPTSNKKDHSAWLPGTSRLLTVKPAPPSSSWWTEYPQAGFTAVAKAHSAHINPWRLHATQGLVADYCNPTDIVGRNTHVWDTD
jgi:hypothetical protein